MFNQIKRYFQRPEKGWDPVPKEHAENYSTAEFRKLDTMIIDELEKLVHSLQGKQVLDLGSGPGQFAINLAQRGAQVTWHDISRNYLEIARKKAAEQNISLTFSLGYMEDARGEYDLVFNRICWYYCVDDRQFAALVYKLVKKGGYGYLIINNENYRKKKLGNSGFLKKLALLGQFYLNELTGIKIGHPHPSHKRIVKLFKRFAYDWLAVDIIQDNTVVRFKK